MKNTTDLESVKHIGIHACEYQPRKGKLLETLQSGVQVLSVDGNFLIYLHPGNIGQHAVDGRTHGTTRLSFNTFVEDVGKFDELALILQKAHGRCTVSMCKV